MDYLSIGLLAIALIVIGLVLVQERSSGAGGIFGGGESGGFYQRRRGIERMVFIGTIVSTVAFVVLSVLNLIY
ncbi:MAG: preprotein translocase subunit SecG [Parcubacteria group bacterium CG1_02_42_13]|nr:MAG: preprotein translocase subunit SecG [Parcubacteria group bacterium CG1_02_42_13]